MEWGIFEDLLCIVSGFYSESEAKAFLLNYETSDGLEVLKICRDHEDEPADYCEACNCE